MKTTDFRFYNRCLENSTLFELEDLSNEEHCEEVFTKFLKYINILDVSDPKRAEGQKLITSVLNIEKYKNLLSVSMQLFDQESVIEEEGVEESANKVQVGQSIQTHQQRKQIRDMNILTLIDFFATGQEQ